MTPTAPLGTRAKSAKAASQHPLLGLTPQARRQLARTLVQGLAITQRDERSVRTRAGLLGGAAYGALGGAAFAAWHLATGGAVVPFLAFYATWGAVQAALTAGLERQGVGLGPAGVATVLDAPRALLRATASWVKPPRFTPDRLVIAAGILVAARRPVSRHLVVRLYGRAYPQGEVNQAIDLLDRLGFVAIAQSESDNARTALLSLTPNGLQLLKGLGVMAPAARPRQDPVVAQHIVPLFAALEGRSQRLPPEPEATVARAPAPVVDLPFAKRVAPVLPVEAPAVVPEQEVQPPPSATAWAPTGPVAEPVQDEPSTPSSEIAAPSGVELPATPEATLTADPLEPMSAAETFEPSVAPTVTEQIPAAPLLEPSFQDLPTPSPHTLAAAEPASAAGLAPVAPLAELAPLPEFSALPDLAAAPEWIGFPELAPLPEFGATPIVEPLPADFAAVQLEAGPLLGAELESDYQHQFDTGELEDFVPSGRSRRVWRHVARATAVAAAIAAVGLLAYFYGGEMNPLGHHDELAARACNMPGPGRGVALQFNGRGKLLSSFGGGLYLSIPDRLDYKTPVSFQNFDMSSSCGLVSREVRRASLSPQGRFLWCEMGGEPGTGPRERCLVNIETKTVTHDLVARDATYGLPGVVGWAGDQQLLMSDEAPPHQAAHWWLMNVGTNKREVVTLPDHARLLPAAAESGMTMLTGWDLRQRGNWDLAVYRLDQQHVYQPVVRTHTTLPESLREAEPRLAAVSPDQRFLLVTMRPVGLEVPAQSGSLIVIALSDGSATMVHTVVPPLPDQPVFWAPEVHGGHYRFFFNGGGPDGAVPCAGEVTPSGA